MKRRKRKRSDSSALLVTLAVEALKVPEVRLGLGKLLVAAGEAMVDAETSAAPAVAVERFARWASARRYTVKDLNEIVSGTMRGIDTERDGK